jgi:hypothetical protein
MAQTRKSATKNHSFLQMHELAILETTGAAKKMIVKDKVWPEPDWSILIKCGMAPEAAALIKIVWKKMPLYPPYDMRDETILGHQYRSERDVRYDYVYIMSLIRDGLYQIKNIGDVRLFREKIMMQFSSDNPLSRNLLYSVWKTNVDPLSLDSNDLIEAKYLIQSGWPTIHSLHFNTVNNPPSRIPARPIITPPYREGMSDTNTLTIDTNFEFHNIIKDTNNIQDIHRINTAFHDLSIALGIDKNQIGLNKTLCIHFDSKRTTNKCSYNTSSKTIIIPPGGGCGDLAKAWAYALIDKTGLNQINITANLLSDIPTTLSIEECKRWSAFIVACHRADPDAYIERYEITNLAQSRINEVKKVMAQRQLWIESHANNTSEGQLYLKHVDQWLTERNPILGTVEKIRLQNAIERDNKAGDSIFLLNAKTLSHSTGKRWDSITEILARAIECAINDGLSTHGGYNKILIHGAEEGRFTQGFLANPYPCGAERICITSAAQKAIMASTISEHELIASVQESLLESGPGGL